MEELPKELFETGNYGIKREYNFTNLNGEKASVELTFGDRLSELKCPIDGANIIIYHDDPHDITKFFYEGDNKDPRPVAECPACREHFDLNNFNEKSNSRYVKSFLIPNKKIIINQLKEKLNNLERVLKLAKDPNNTIKKENLNNSCYNKDNLSAKEDKQ